MREWQKKLESGEYIREWNGYSPFYAGCMYGSSTILGGEKEFTHCYDFFSGIGDVEWWIVEELEKLSASKQEELLVILKRNKEANDLINSSADRIKKMTEELNLEAPYVIYRKGNKKILELLSSENLKESWERIEQCS